MKKDDIANGLLVAFELLILFVVIILFLPAMLAAKHITPCNRVL